MAPWQQRVVDEKAQLDERFVKLGKFMEDNAFFQLPEAERERLKRQYAAMKAYTEVLGERIAEFT